MAFKTSTPQTQNNTTTSTVDWEALNRSVVEEAGIEERVTDVGYVSMIVDLGNQEQPDAEFEWNGTEEEKEQILKDFPNTYFKEGVDPKTRKKIELRCWPSNPLQSVAIAIDFPTILVDKGKFFGESKPLPLRIWMGGEFYTREHGMIMGRMNPLRITRLRRDDSSSWSLGANSVLYRMATASGLIKNGETFLPEQIDQLLGKAFQFDVQVYFNKAKDGKEYYNEYVKFVGGLARGMKEPEVITTPYLVQFDAENDPEALRQIRSHVVNTMKMALNFDESMIKEQLENRYNNTNTNPPKEEAKPVGKPKRATRPPVEDEDEDGLLPF